MMQRLKEFVADLGAITAVGGSANVLTFSAKSSFSSYVDGIRVAFRASVDNTGAATLNVNAVGAKPIVKFTWDGEKALDGGEVQAGCIYEVIYSGALNGASGAWLLLNPTPKQETQQIAAGLMLPCGSTTVPTGWLECNGAAISRTTYATLFASIGTAWGTGDGSTTFNVPDLRGEFLRGWDHGRGVDTGRAFASAQSDDIKTIPDVWLWSGSESTKGFADGTNYLGRGSTQNRPADWPDGTETRPRNKAVMYVIKT